MSAVYDEVKAALSGRVLRAGARIRNDSPSAWRAGERFRIGFRIMDAETGTLVADGSRVSPDRDIAPGDAMRADFAIEIPSDPGHYEIEISPLREGECWYCDRGWFFLLIEAVVTRDAVSLRPPRATTAGRMRSARLVRSFGRAFTYPVLTVWRNRGLIRTMVRRDILGRYRGSFGGAFWTIINPLLLMLTYFFVFGVVLQARFGSDPSRAGFALYFLAGMLPWLAFSEAAGRAPTVMLEHRNFVKKLVFSVETLPVNLVAAGLVSELVAVVLFCVGLLLARGAVPATVLWVPVLLIPQLLFTAGVCWFLAALGVFARDLGQIIGFVLTLWFFLTPICYPEASLPAWALPVLSKNPMYVLVRGYRAVLLEGAAPPWAALAKLTLATVAVFIVGHAWFYKLRKSFADLL